MNSANVPPKPKAREREVPKGLLALAYDEHVWTCLKLNKSESSIVLYHDGEKTETSLLLSEWFDRERGELTHGALKAAPDIEGAELEVAALRQNAARAASYRVHHTKFGEGTVLSEEGTGENQKLEVAFADGTTRKLLARFVKRVD